MKKLFLILTVLQITNIFAGGACSKGANTARVAPVPNPQPAPAPVPQPRPAQPTEEERKRNAATKPMHLQDIFALPKSSDAQKNAFKALMAYYGNGTLSQSPYEQEVAQICEAARKYFLSIRDAQSKVIVFDIDETMLSRYYDYYYRYVVKSYKRHISKAQFREHLDASKPLALAPVKKLWDAVGQMGFQRVVISSMPVSARNERLEELTQAGYKVAADQLYAMPNLLNSQAVAFSQARENAKSAAIIANWKLEIRKSLKNVAGNVGDFPTDFTCDCNPTHGPNACPHSGFKVELPQLIIKP